MRVRGRLRVPTMRLREILHQAKGGSSWLSPLRSHGSLDDQAVEAGPEELQLSGGQKSQIKVKGKGQLPLQRDCSRGSQKAGQWAEQRATLMKHLLKRVSWATALSLTK